MSECNFVEERYYQKNKDMIPNRAKDYYKNDKKKIKRPSMR